MRITILLLPLLLGWSSLEVASASYKDPASIVEVRLKQGAIKASKVDLDNGKFYYSFKNIPFAEPPVGFRRFKEPVPAGPWLGIRDGTVVPTPCPQSDSTDNVTGVPKILGEEDCLYLNVDTPTPYASDLPVMVWIHGGGFTGGSIRNYDPKPLMTKDVIVVSLQYRLGALGFLSTEDSVMPTNLGMKDQVMALRWIQENIRDLGGDPNKVTIFGESAGGMSVHMHMMSPLSEGLFQQAILQSGTAILPGFTLRNPRKTAIAVGEKLECKGVNPTDFNSQALRDCLQDLPTEEIIALNNALVEFWMSPQLMVPSFGDDFLPDHPLKLMREGRYQRMNVMMGVTRDEAAIFAPTIAQNRAIADTLAANFSRVGPVALNLEKDDEYKVYIAKRIFYHYLNDLNITEENVDQAVKLFSDLMFKFPTDISAKLHASDTGYGNKLYLYEFHHLGPSALQAFVNITSGKYAAHADELLYLFNLPDFNVTLTRDRDMFMQEIMTTLWTNFARTGNPTPDLSLGFKWTPVSDPEDLKFLILKTSPHMCGFTRQEEFEFWMNLPLKEHRMYFPERFRPEGYSGIKGKRSLSSHLPPQRRGKVA